jgi:hypothetical protein
MRRIVRSLRSYLSGDGRGTLEILTFYGFTTNYTKYRTFSGGQFGWGGTSLKTYQGCPIVSSVESETQRRV